MDFGACLLFNATTGTKNVGASWQRVGSASINGTVAEDLQKCCLESVPTLAMPDYAKELLEQLSWLSTEST